MKHKLTGVEKESQNEHHIPPSTSSLAHSRYWNPVARGARDVNFIIQRLFLYYLQWSGLVTMKYPKQNSSACQSTQEDAKPA